MGNVRKYSGKTKKKPYRGSKKWDTSCRNHGNCSWCKRNRLHKFRKGREGIEE